MRELSATLREISTRYFSPAHGFSSTSDIVEGQRYLSHLLGAACEFYLEGDALRPYFVRMVSPVRKFLGDNPDAVYHFSLIDGQRDYRIRGRRMGQEYIAYTVHGGEAADGDWNIPGTAHINHRQLRANLRGEYELFLGPMPQPGRNWLQTGPQARYVVCRHYYENQQIRRRRSSGAPQTQHSAAASASAAERPVARCRSRQTPLRRHPIPALQHP